MKKTVLYDAHISLGAKMATFGGYDMPIQYEGILSEHFATRKQATVFDTCHMGEFRIWGPDAVKDLDNILTCHVATIKTGQCRYGLICNYDGGVLDDQILYRMGDAEFFMVVNASTQDTDLQWIMSNKSSDTSIKNLSPETGKIDLQGPLSAKIITQLLKYPVDDLKYYHWMHNEYDNKEILISRTGYTGEIGFEIFLEEKNTKSLWDDCLRLGARPAGLGARDTLRLEMGYMLYGNDIDETTTPLEAGIGWTVKFKKQDFSGREALLRQKEQGLSRKLVGFEVDGRRVARHGMVIESGGRPVGRVTSGTFSPSLERPIGMGYVESALDRPGGTLEVLAGGTRLDARIVPRPFWTRGSRRS